MPKTDIHGNLPSIGALLVPNDNIDINSPKIDIPKVDITVSQIDIHGPNIDIPKSELTLIYDNLL